MLHSHTVRNITLRSFGYLNDVSIDSYFIIKAYLESWPARCLAIFCTLAFLIGSWSLRACDYQITREHLSILDGMWLFCMTFTTVGMCVEEFFTEMPLVIVFFCRLWRSISLDILWTR
jgi:hypothetical protein